MVFNSLQNSVDKIQAMQYEDTSSFINNVILESIKGHSIQDTTNTENLDKIANPLNLLTNTEFLMESVALANLKETVDDTKMEIEFVDSMFKLISHMHDCFIRKIQVKSINGVTLPMDFCCPLSLRIMCDPVIVASGQTYERGFIKKWLELGFSICPKTRQVLGHTNLIPNYTVKALIANWCEINHVKLPDSFLPNGMDENSKCTTNSNGKMINISSSEEQLRGLGNKNSDTMCEVSTTQTEKQSDITCRSSNASDISSSDSRERKKEDKTPQPVVHSSIDAECEMPISKNAPSSSQQTPMALIGDYQSRLKNQTIWRRPSQRISPRISSSLESHPDFSVLDNQVRKLIEELKTDSIDAQRTILTELLTLTRQKNMENILVIANCGAIKPLVSNLLSPDLKIQEIVVTLLLNLSLSDNNKTAIAKADAVEPLIHVLKTGTPEARQNSAATLCSLSVIEENKIKIGRSGAIDPLVELLGNGDARGKKDASTALYNLSLYPEHKARIVQAGAVKHLVDLMDSATGMVDMAVALLSNLATIPNGRSEIGHNSGIPMLVEVVELGSPKGKENAAAALLQLCTNSNKFCSIVLQEGAVPPLAALSQCGTPRAKEKVNN